MGIDDQLETIRAELTAAQQHLDILRITMSKIEQAGMYPAISTEQWQRRNRSRTKYLYMLFRRRPSGGYQGPGGKRKVYVGAKPDRIAEARRLAENRQRWEELDSTVSLLKKWLTWQTHAINSLADESKHWPRVDLGPEIAGAARPQSPNG